MTRTGERRAEGKAAIAGKEEISEKDVSLDTLDLDSTVRSELSKKEVRKSLSYIWQNSVRSKEANKFSDTLQKIQESNDSDNTNLDTAKTSFLEMVK